MYKIKKIDKENYFIHWKTSSLIWYKQIDRRPYYNKIPQNLYKFYNFIIIFN